MLLKAASEIAEDTNFWKMSAFFNCERGLDVLDQIDKFRVFGETYLFYRMLIHTQIQLLLTTLLD